jgi:hypothetical protein
MLSPHAWWISGAGRERRVHRRHDGQRLVLDDDLLQRVFRAGSTRRDDRPDRLSGVDRLVDRQDRIIAPLEARALAEHRQHRLRQSTHVLRRERQHNARQTAACRGVDSDDACVRVRAPQHGQV